MSRSLLRLSSFLQTQRSWPALGGDSSAMGLGDIATPSHELHSAIGESYDPLFNTFTLFLTSCRDMGPHLVLGLSPLLPPLPGGGRVPRRRLANAEEEV